MLEIRRYGLISESKSCVYFKEAIVEVETQQGTFLLTKNFTWIKLSDLYPFS